MSRRRKNDPDLHGVVLLDKPAGPTSHDVVGWVRWVLGMRRVGHCGTLDPAATGLLVVGVGLATKLAPYLTGQDKGYRARFVLGARTTTADAEGEVLEDAPCPEDLEPRVPKAVRDLLGVQHLPPPAYSALHVDGRRAHELAREGRAPVLEPRAMTVHRVEPGAVHRQGSRVTVEASLLVSKGTYIRSLAEALGRSLGLPAHLGALHRDRSGALSLEHPRAVQGLTARPLEPRSEGPARWRIGLAARPEAPRAELAEHLRAHLLAPWQAVPLPVLRVRDDASGHRALARLASGMALSLDDPGLPPGPADAERLAVAPAQPEVEGLIVVVRQGEGPDLRLQPERVVIAPPRAP